MIRTCIIGASLLAAVALAPHAPASAAQGGFAAWLADAVDKKLVYPYALQRAEIGGIATVAFDVGTDGQPANARIARSSGKIGLDAAAVKTVASLGRLPAEAPRGTHHVILQFGTAGTYATLAEFGRKMEAESDQVRLAVREQRRPDRMARRAAGSATVNIAE